MKYFVLVAALALLRMATVFVSSCGLGALAVALVSWPFMSTPDVPWVGTLFAFSATVAVLCLLSAVFSWRRMPSAAAIHRRDADDVHTATGQRVLLAGLAIAATLQLPALLNWWTEDRILLRMVLGSRWDPLSLNLIPAVMLFSLPALATVTLVVFVATSIAATLASRQAATAVLMSGAILQIGLVLAGYMALGAIQELGQVLVQALEGAPDAIAPQAADFLARHDSAARDVTARVAAIFVGYLVTLVVSIYGARTVEATDTRASGLAVHPESLPAEPVAVASISQASVAFDQSQYVVRIRNRFVALIVPGQTSYDIQTIPPTARARFSFSWVSGTLRREPSGPDVLHIKAAERRELFKRTYVVTEAATASVLGKLAPSGSDWEILDAYGRVVSTIVQTAASFEREQYMMKIGHEDVCRFTWLNSSIMATGEFDVEFLPNATAQFDRALAMALAPVLERKARKGKHA